MKIILALFSVFIFTIVITIAIFRINDFKNNSDFKKIKEGMKISECRNILGDPDEIKMFDEELVMDVYHYFPNGEAIFFYNKTTKRLNRSWKTDWD